MRRRARQGFVLVAAAVLVATSACAPARPRASPAPFSEFVHAWLGWSEAGQPLLRIALSVRASDLRDPPPGRPARLVVTAAVDGVDDVRGNAWTFDLDANAALRSEVADGGLRRQLTLPTAPGSQTLGIVLMFAGEPLAPEWLRRFDIPEPAPDVLALEEPQFLERSSGVPTVVRYFDDTQPTLRLSSSVFDPQPTTPREQFEVALDLHREGAEPDAPHWARVDTLERRGVLTPYEIDIPLPPVGTHTLRATLRVGERTATAEQRVQIGFSALADLGLAEEGLELLRLFFTPAAISDFEAASPESRAALWESMWRDLDPYPETDRNELQEEIQRRVREANRRFSTNNRGWRSVRGLAYIKWGEPDEIETLQRPNQFERLERWAYYEGNKVLVFIDRYGRGEFELLRSNVPDFEPE